MILVGNHLLLTIYHLVPQRWRHYSPIGNMFGESIALYLDHRMNRLFVENKKERMRRYFCRQMNL
jgi:hypothetical protein